MRTHRLDAGPETVHWGFFDASLKPLLTVEPGDEVVISTVSGPPTAMPPANSGLTVPDALARHSRGRCAETERTSHPHRAGRGARRQSRAGA